MLLAFVWPCGVSVGSPWSRSLQAENSLGLVGPRWGLRGRVTLTVPLTRMVRTLPNGDGSHCHPGVLSLPGALTAELGHSDGDWDRHSPGPDAPLARKPYTELRHGRRQERRVRLPSRPNPLVWLPYALASLYRHDLFIVLALIQ
jgi:hypothetical protein